jgi:hypothetical protein
MSGLPIDFHRLDNGDWKHDRSWNFVEKRISGGWNVFSCGNDCRFDKLEAAMQFIREVSGWPPTV